MSDVLERITAWQAAGIIDEATADRLRQNEAESTAAAPAASAGIDAGHAPVVPSEKRSAAAAMFGPSVTIAEVFVFLGGAFVVGAWSAFMSRTATSTQDPELALGVGADRRGRARRDRLPVQPRRRARLPCGRRRIPAGDVLCRRCVRFLRD